jgi:hypothetical protein
MKMPGLDSRLVILVVIIAISVMAANAPQASVPHKINYQGKLVDSATGEPEAGTHGMVFRIYDDSAAGLLLWSESRVISSDSAGVLSAHLGSTTPIAVYFDGPVWLEVDVEGEILSPRREMVSAPNIPHLKGRPSRSEQVPDRRILPTTARSWDTEPAITVAISQIRSSGPRRGTRPTWVIQIPS